MIVAPDAWASRRGESLRLLVDRLSHQRAPAPTVVCWQSGPLTAEFEALAPVIDAGAVNGDASVRALTSVRLRPLARRLKTLRLRRLLAPLAPRSQVLLGGLGAMAYHHWLPPGRRTMVLWLDPAAAEDDHDPTQLLEAREVVASFLVSDEHSARALASVGVPLERVHRVGEPVVVREPSLRRAPALRGDRGIVAVVGGTPDDADVAELLAILATTSTIADDFSVAWVQDDLQSAWARWADDRFAGVESHVEDWSVEHCRHRLDDLVALVVLAPLPHPLVAHAAAAGVPVLDRDGAAGDLGAGDNATPLPTRLADLLDDARRWQAASDQSRFRARLHDVDHVVDVVLQSLERTG